MHAGSTSCEKSIWILIAILIANLAIKLAALLYFHHVNLITPNSWSFIHLFLEMDTHTYLTPASTFLTTGQLLGVLGTKYLFFRTPGYPLFLALILYFCHHNLLAIIIAQVFLSLIPLVCFYVIGRRLFSPAVGLVAALFISLDYLMFSYSFMVLTDGLFAVLISLALMCCVLALTCKRLDYISLLFLGVFLALATLVRPIGYYLIFPTAIGLVVYLLVSRCALKKVLYALFFLLIPFVLLVGGWQIRNKILMNTYSFSGITSARAVKLFFPENYNKYMAAKSHQKTTLDYNKKALASDLKILTDYPEDTVKTIAKGFLRVMLGTENTLSKLLIQQESYSFSLTDVASAISHLSLKPFERSNVDPSYKKFRSMFFMMLGINLIVLFLFVCGLIFTVRKGFLMKSKGAVFSHLFLMGIILYFVLLSSNAQGVARFRLPFQAIIDFYAAVGVIFLFSKKGPVQIKEAN